MHIPKFFPMLFLAASASILARAQTMTASPEGIPARNAPASGVVTTPTPRVGSIYIQPTQSAMLHNYLWETFGPYPIGGSIVVGGWNQLKNSVPEWQQGAAGYGRRVGSDFGIAVVRTTTRYGLAELLHEDTLYYRCRCTGILPRTGHALISTVMSRRGLDGHWVFSFPSLVAPYAGTMTAVYGWYPDRYNAKDAFRMGNYSLLGLMVGNIGLEFLHTGADSFVKRFHLYNAHGAD